MFASSFLLKKENISFDRGLLNLQLLYVKPTNTVNVINTNIACQ